MITILVTVGLLVGKSAFGGFDPEPNKLGLYFDLEARFPCEVAYPFESVTAYLILTNATSDMLFGWEAAVRPVSEELFVGSAEVMGGGTNSLEAPEFAVTYESPLETESVTVLATFELASLVYEENCLILTGISSPSLPEDLPLIWWEASVPSVIQTTNIQPNGVVASIGGCPVVPESPWPCANEVPVSRFNWGSLKSIYR